MAIMNWGTYLYHKPSCTTSMVDISYYGLYTDKRHWGHHLVPMVAIHTGIGNA